jgi:CHAT domain-containing protein
VGGHSVDLDVTVSVGFAARGAIGGGGRKNQWHSLAVATGCLILLLLASGCSRETASYQETYNSTWAFLNRGELPNALREVDSQLRRIPRSEEYWYWKFTALKAEILMQERNTRDALVLLQPSLPPSLAETDVDLWRKMTLGIANAYQLNFGEAQSLLDDAEALAIRKYPALRGDVALRKGTVALTQSHFGPASAQYHAALQSARVGNNPYLQAAALGSLGLIAARQEHYDESLEWNRRALERAVAIHADSSVARILGNLGWSYLEMGDYDRALDLLEQARVAAEKAGTTRLQIDVLSNIGIAYYEQRDYEHSKRSYQQALTLATSISDSLAMAESFQNLAQLGLATGQLELAQDNQDKVTEFVRQHPDPSLQLYSVLIQGQLQETRRDYKHSEASFERVIQDSTATAAQKWEAQSHLAETYDAEDRFADADQLYRDALATIDKARSSFGAEELRLAFLSRPISVYGHYIEFLLKHSRDKEALEVAERSRAETLQEGLTSRPNGHGSAMQRLQPQQISKQMHATLLCYWLGEAQSYLWVINPHGTTYFRLPAAGEIQKTVKAYRQAVVETRDVLREGNRDGQRLYSMLVEPAKSLVPKGSRIMVLPSESLYGLNFETLIVKEPSEHFWIEDATLSTGSSLRLLSSSAQHVPAKQKSLLLVANPEPANQEFPSLAQAPEEMKRTMEHFSMAQREVLEGKGATAAAYLESHPERFSYLHFVTHGTDSHTRPLESAVILSRSGDSYKLYARDILTRPLKADLVTISACNAAGTRTFAGEGLVGLSWAFLRAGARNVIASLWEVSDATSTPQLMDSLYEGLDRGEDPATALRKAKLELIRANSHNVFAKPFYWAPFQLYAGS